MLLAVDSLRGGLAEGNRIHLFSIVFILFSEPVFLPSAGSTPYMGCWIDSSTRTMSSAHGYLPVADAWQRCLHIARSQGHDYFAIQAGTYCFTDPDTSYMTQGAAADADCPVSSGHHHGGNWRNAVYRISGMSWAAVTVALVLVMSRYRVCYRMCCGAGRLLQWLVLRKDDN